MRFGVQGFGDCTALVGTVPPVSTCCDAPCAQEVQLAGCRKQLGVVRREQEYVTDQLTTTEVSPNFPSAEFCTGTAVQGLLHRGRWTETAAVQTDLGHLGTSSLHPCSLCPCTLIKGVVVQLHCHSVSAMGSSAQNMHRVHSLLRGLCIAWAPQNGNVFHFFTAVGVASSLFAGFDGAGV